MRHDRAVETWQLDPAATHGEYGIRHAVRGHRVYGLELRSGTLWLHPDQSLRLTGEFVLSGATRRAGASPTLLRFEGAASGPEDVNRYRVRGELRRGEQWGPFELQLHDLGWTEDVAGRRRRFAAISGTLDRRLWRCDERRPLTGRMARFFVDAEWLPATAPLTAA